jgi:hypothetical protein
MAIAVPYTYQDIMDHIESLWERDSALPTPRFVLQLCNQAMREIAEETRPLKKTWTGATTPGDDSIVGINVNSKVFQFNWPIDLINIISVHYTSNGVWSPLDLTTHEALDVLSAGWQDPSSITGVPSKYCVDAQFVELDMPVTTGDVTKIIVQGYCHFPVMTTSETISTTPLQYIPLTHQLSLAWYVLSELPIRDDRKEDLIRQARYQAKWEQARLKIISALGSRDAQWVN